MEVVLHIYDLSGGLAKQMSMAMVGKQVRPTVCAVIWIVAVIYPGKATTVCVYGLRLLKHVRVSRGQSDANRCPTCSLMASGIPASSSLVKNFFSAAVSSKARPEELLMASLFRNSRWAQHTYPRM
jgi:hypothetical protein